MLFLDFLCLFVCIVLLNARPMFKSMDYENSYENKVNTLVQPHFKQYSGKCEIKTDVKDSPNALRKKSMKFKRKVASKDLDLKVFDKFETKVDSKSLVKMLKNSIENSTISILPTLSTKIYKLHQLYVPNDAKFIVNKEKINNIFDKNDVSTMSINDDMEFLGTAEIEEVLNDIKHREIQMIADQEPTITNLITNAVTETSFISVPYVAQSNIFPGNAFSTFLFNSYPNKNLTRKSLTINKRQIQNKPIRSMEEDSCTLACNIERKLQKKLRKTYRKLKAKLSKEYSKEIKQTTATIKEEIKKITKQVSKKICTLPYKTETKSVVKNKLMNKKPHIKETRFYTKSTKSIEKLIEGSKFPISTRKMQTSVDEFLLLSTFEQLLAKTNGNNLKDKIILTTQNNFDYKRSRRFPNRNPKTNFIIEENNNENSYKDGDEITDVEYTDLNNNADNLTTTDTITEKYDRSQVTANTNYRALSDKISFNDYVNGYKYYLNFQKDNDDEKYSNLVRYQAHKHHNVDDIGKFILKKIPRLPSTRNRRFFVESETLEDQDVSTKSDDSWFKKHFFVYLDTNPPRKFHTSQTVSLKAPELHTSKCTTKSATTTYKHEKLTQPQTKTIVTTRQRTHNLSTNSKLVDPLEYFEKNRRFKTADRHVSWNIYRKRRSTLPYTESSESKDELLPETQSKHKISKKKIQNKKYSDKRAKTLSNITHRKNGVVNIDLVHRSTGIVKLNKNNKRKSKIQNLFKKFKKNRGKPEIYNEGKKDNRKQRHIFNNLKNIFHEKSKNEKKNGLKLFDYKIVTPKEAPETYSYNHFNSLKNLNVEDIWNQIPTITGDNTYPYYFLQPQVYSNEKLFYSRKPKLDLKTESFSFSSGKSFPHFDDNQDEVFDVKVKTDYTNQPEPAFTLHMKAINNPTLVNMISNNMKNVVDNMKQRIENGQSVEDNTLLFNNKILITKDFPLNKHRYKSDHFEESNKNKVYALNKHTQDHNYHDVVKDIEVKYTQPSLVRFSKNYVTERYISGKKNFESTEKVNLGKKQNKVDIKKLNKSVIEQRVPISKVTKVCHTRPFPFSVSMIMKGRNRTLNNSFKNHNGKIIFDGKGFRGQTIQPMAKNYKETTLISDGSYTLKRSQNKGIYNTKISKLSLSPITRVNTPPEQYFTTFLPMQINDFHKFLKEKEIDVESVTAPLVNSLPRSLDSWNSKKVSSSSKLKEGISKNYISPKPTRSSEKLDSLHFQYQNQKDESAKKVNNLNDHYQYGNTRSQKSVYDRLKRIKSVTGGYMGNILTSQKDLHLTVIDLDNEIFNPGEVAVSTEKIKHQNDDFTLNEKVSDKDLKLYLSMPNKNRDPLRFSHLTTEGYFSRYINSNTVAKKPERVQISGHGYKYDIIYHKPLSNHDERNSDNRGYADLFLISGRNNDDTYSPTLEKPEVLSINKNPSLRSQRGTIKARQIQSSHYNSDSNKQVKRRKHDIFHKKACKEDNQYKIMMKNTKYKYNSSAIHAKNKQIISNTKNDDSHNVYIEPKLLHEATDPISTATAIIISKHEKRSAQEEKYTAKDVAALEVVVDLMKNTPAYDGKDGIISAFNDNTDHKSVHHLISMPQKERHVTNSIQVHIAIPCNTDDKKRSLEPIRLRKVFSALMSSPVDLEYRIHSFEETTTAPTSIVQDFLTPGLYLLVENTNITCPEGNFVLKPIKTSLDPSKWVVRQVTSSTEKKQNNSLPSVNTEKLSLNKDSVSAVNKETQINENIELNKTNSKTKRSASTEVGKNEINNTEISLLVPEKKRNINWNSIKKYFGHDRVCHCHCKANQTMCRECAACNAIITELMFEMENLAKYMTEHCTEIQTFFWMNPSGGRKLRDVIHRIDITLSDYYKRVKGKCQGRTCQMLSSNIDKRSFNYLYNDNLTNRLSELGTDLENALKYKMLSDEVWVSGIKLSNMANGCMTARLHKRSGSIKNTKQPIENTIYSLSNIKVNLICNKDFTKPSFVARNTIYKGDTEKNTDSELFFDEEEIKKMKKNSYSLKSFLKNCSIKKKSRTKDLSSGDSYMRNWRIMNRLARSSLPISQEHSQPGKIIRHTRESLNPVRFQLNKTHEHTNENTNLSENYKINEYTDYKHDSKNEVKNYLVDKKSLSNNINELLKLLYNVDLIEAMTTKSSFYLNQTITRKESLFNKTGTKTINNLSQLKTNIKPKLNPRVSRKKSSSKSTLAMTTVSKSGKHRVNKSRIQCLTDATKLNFTNKPQKFPPKKDQLRNRMNISFTTTSENYYTRNLIPKHKNHQFTTQKVKNDISRNDKKTNNATSALLIIIDDNDNTFYDQRSTTKNIFKTFYHKNAVLSSNSTSVTNSSQDGRVKPDNNMKGCSDNENETIIDKLNRTLHCKSGTQTTITSKDYTYDYNYVLQSLKNVPNDISNYTVFSTEPKTNKGLLGKIADQFVIKIFSDREMKKDSKKCHKCFTTTSKQKGNKGYLKSDEKKDKIHLSSKSVIDKGKLLGTTSVTTPSTITKTIHGKKKNEKLKLKGESISKGSKETDDRNKVCDIASTINYVVKMHDSMPKKDFEQYVKSISCHKYKPMPKNIYFQYNTKHANKKHTKYRRKCKASKNYNKNLLKWDWIRDRRSVIVDDTRIELDNYEDNENFNNTELDTAAHDFQYNNAHKNSRAYRKKYNQCNEITTTSGIAKNCDIQNQKYFKGHRVAKRSLLSIDSLLNNKQNKNKANYQLLNLSIDNKTNTKEQYYELFFKGKDGIYHRSYDRRKRSDANNNLDVLRRGLKNLPSLRPLSDEIFVTMGDSVSFNCNQPSISPNQSMSDYIWSSERNEMLDHENVVINGSKIFLSGVDTRNSGTYFCSKDNAVVRSIKVTITNIPSFNIVSTPLYRTDSACTYKDLEAVLMLDSEILRECCGKYCSVRIDEPICLKDRLDDSSYLRPIVVISLNAIPNINCSSECKRNLQCSIATLLVSNMPALSFVKVLISFDDNINKTLTPLIGSKRRAFVTHTLRRKDSNGHNEYHNIAADMGSGHFDLVLRCPAGFYLISEQKICVVCPSNTFSEEGDNVCRICPDGTRAAPGSRHCRLPYLRSRRFAWNANEWSIPTVCALAFSALAVCYGAISLLRRTCCSQGNNTCNSRGNTRLGRSKPNQKSPGRRPPSPSHVILSRLLRGSMTSSRATDSQENRFELWKEKNTLPPLPPIDFDL